MNFAAALAVGQTALELGLICSLTVLALFLSYSMLNVCDLSTDGCFTLGAAVGAMTAAAGHPLLSIPAAILAGMCSGFVTALLQTKMGVDSLLAGIIVNTGLYSVNIAVMAGSSLVNLNKTDTVFTMMKDLLAGTPLENQYKTVVAAIAVVLTVAFLTFFLNTRLGLAIRATGNNPDMVRSSSINPVFTTIVGLCVANALASLLIGNTLMGRGGIFTRAVGMVLGAFVFRLVYGVALQLDMMPSFMLRLVSSAIVVLAISLPYLKQQWPMLRRRLAARKGGV